MTLSYDSVKRVLDLTLGGAALLVTLPAQGVVACLVRYKLGSPIFFRQERPGKDGRIFELVKFRTMLDVDERKDLITDEQRLTTFGSVLRSTSLDELPSLWNVVKGDMSLVGPRPLRVRYLALYTPEQARRHEVRPGITGLAQVSGRNLLDWEDRFALDVRYVAARSLSLDIRILCRTAIQVLRRRGIAAEGYATMTPFKGSSHR